MGSFATSRNCPVQRYDSLTVVFRTDSQVSEDICLDPPYTSRERNCVESAVSRQIPKPGRAWAYESIIHAIPGYELPRRLALAVQFLLFETAILLLAVYYDLWEGAVLGTLAVIVAVVGSLGMLRISTRARQAGAPEAYLRLLFGSRIDLVLGVIAYALVITYLFAIDTGENALLTRLLGEELPPAALFVLLVVLWDVCYRIGTNWWATVVALWRSRTLELEPETRRALIRVDAETIALSGAQLLLLPFVAGQPLLAIALIGHLLAVVLVAGSSILLLRRAG